MFYLPSSSTSTALLLVLLLLCAMAATAMRVERWQHTAQFACRAVSRIYGMKRHTHTFVWTKSPAVGYFTWECFALTHFPKNIIHFISIFLHKCFEFKFSNIYGKWRGSHRVRRWLGSAKFVRESRWRGFQVFGRHLERPRHRHRFVSQSVCIFISYACVALNGVIWQFRICKCCRMINASETMSTMHICIYFSPRKIHHFLLCALRVHQTNDEGFPFTTERWSGQFRACGTVQCKVQIVHSHQRRSREERKLFHGLPRQMGKTSEKTWSRGGDEWI